MSLSLPLPDPDEIADEVLPLGGPYSPERVTAAGALMSELVRRLNHATSDGGHSLPYPSTVDRLVGNLNGAVSGLRQLLMQSAGRLEDFAAMPSLYADAEARGRSAADIAKTAASLLRGEAATRAVWTASTIGEAARLTARLGLREEIEAAKRAINLAHDAIDQATR